MILLKCNRCHITGEETENPIGDIFEYHEPQHLEGCGSVQIKLTWNIETNLKDNDKKVHYCKKCMIEFINDLFTQDAWKIIATL